MPGKTNVRASRQRRKREAVFSLWARGFSVVGISKRLGVSERDVVRVLKAAEVKVDK